MIHKKVRRSLQLYNIYNCYIYVKLSSVHICAYFITKLNFYFMSSLNCYLSGFSTFLSSVRGLLVVWLLWMWTELEATPAWTTEQKRRNLILWKRPLHRIRIDIFISFYTALHLCGTSSTSLHRTSSASRRHVRKSEHRSLVVMLWRCPYYAVVKRVRSARPGVHQVVGLWWSDRD